MFVGIDRITDIDGFFRYRVIVKQWIAVFYEYLSLKMKVKYIDVD